MKQCHKLMAWVMAMALLPVVASAGSIQEFDGTGWAGDLSVSDGRITGSLEKYFPEYECTGMMYMDCAVPEDLPTECRERLQVEFIGIPKDEFITALQAVGTKPKANYFQIHRRDPLQRGSMYRLAQDYDINGFPLPGTVELTPELEKARDIALQLTQQLDIEVFEPSTFVCRYDDRPFPRYHFVDRHDELAGKLYERFQGREKKLKRDPAKYTYVEMRPTIRGLPLSQTLSYPDGTPKEPNARVGIPCGLHFLLKEDRTIVVASIYGISIEVAAEPIPELATWREALAALLASDNGPFWSKEQEPQVTELGFGLGDGISFPAKAVLTKMEPAWVGLNKFELTPGWCFTFEDRVRGSQEVTGITRYYVDAATQQFAGQEGSW